MTWLYLTYQDMTWLGIRYFIIADVTASNPTRTTSADEHTAPGSEVSAERGTPPNHCTCFAATIPENRRQFVPHAIACPARPRNEEGQAGCQLAVASGNTEIAAPETASPQDGGGRNEESGRAGFENGRTQDIEHTCFTEAGGRACTRQLSPNGERAPPPPPPPFPPPTVVATSNLNPDAAAFDPIRSRAAERLRPPPYSSFTFWELRRLAAEREVCRVHFILFNILAFETTKALAAAAAIFGVSFLDARIEHPPRVLKSLINDQVQKTQLLSLSVACPLDYDTILKEERFRHCRSIPCFQKLCEQTELAWVRFNRRTRLRLSESEDGLCYNTMLRHSSPNLLYASLPRSNPNPTLLFFDPVKLSIRYTNSQEELYQQLDISES